jgi:hypothetical protein
MKMKLFTRYRLKWLLPALSLSIFSIILMSSSHREAPMIADDPQADNTDLYAFRNPRNPNKVVIIANYYPFQLPQGGPNFYHFGEDVRYEIHVDNNAETTGDDIIYRFTFSRAESRRDPTTFFLIRLGKENLRTKYVVDRSMDGGKSWLRVLHDGIVPPPNVGPRSIKSAVGLGAPDYDSLIYKNIQNSGDGERIFAGPVDDPFFVDLGGAFDLGDLPRQSGRSVDGLKCLNVLSIALEMDISLLQKDRKPVAKAKNILDPDYVVGIWASASRQKITTLNDAPSRNPNTRGSHSGFDSHSGDWVQISRLGMPLTNEVVVPIGYKDYWNRLTPYDDLSRIKEFGEFFYKPELALYMDDAQFGGAVLRFAPLRIQKKSLGQFDFSNGGNGLFGLKGNAALDSTALAESAFGVCYYLLLTLPFSRPMAYFSYRSS